MTDEETPKTGVLTLGSACRKRSKKLPEADWIKNPGGEHSG